MGLTERISDMIRHPSDGEIQLRELARRVQDGDSACCNELFESYWNLAGRNSVLGSGTLTVLEQLPETLYTPETGMLPPVTESIPAEQTLFQSDS